LRLATQKRLVFALLVFLVAWPLLHHALAARYHLAPWKLFGWSMYCVPSFQPAIELYALDAGRRTRVDLSEPRHQKLAAAVTWYAARRTVWGELYPPDRIVEVAFRSISSPQLEIVIIHGFLDRHTAHLNTRRYNFAYGR